jgi:hypothetical protein
LKTKGFRGAARSAPKAVTKVAHRQSRPFAFRVPLRKPITRELIDRKSNWNVSIRRMRRRIANGGWAPVLPNRIVNQCLTASLPEPATFYFCNVALGEPIHFLARLVDVFLAQPHHSVSSHPAPLPQSQSPELGIASPTPSSGAGFPIETGCRSCAYTHNSSLAGRSGVLAVTAPAQGFSQDSRHFLLDSFDAPRSAGYAVINDEFAAASLLRLAPNRSIDIPWRSTFGITLDVLLPRVARHARGDRDQSRGGTPKGDGTTARESYVIGLFHCRLLGSPHLYAGGWTAGGDNACA